MCTSIPTIIAEVTLAAVSVVEAVVSENRRTPDSGGVGGPEYGQNPWNSADYMNSPATEQSFLSTGKHKNAQSVDSD